MGVTHLPDMAAQQHRCAQFQGTSIGLFGIRAIVLMARCGILTLGIAAVAALCVLFFKPQLTERFKSLSPYANVTEEEHIAIFALQKPNIQIDFRRTASVTSPANTMTTPDGVVSHTGIIRQQRSIGNWLSKRYHIASGAAQETVSASYQTAKEASLDPLLILAVISVESRFNPFAEGALGAQGLMQVSSKEHQDKIIHIGRAEDILNPVANIRAGARILKDDLSLGGSLESGLKMYAETSAPNNGASDVIKILIEYQRLKRIAAGNRTRVISSRSQNPNSWGF